MSPSPHHLVRFAALVTLPLVLTALACGGGGGGTPSQPPPPSGSNVVIVDVNDFAFDPATIRVNPGTTVRFVMRGSDPNHTATAVNGRFDSGFVFKNPGDTFEVQFTSADDDQTFDFACTSHQGCCKMQGSISVGDNAPPSIY